MSSVSILEPPIPPQPLHLPLPTKPRQAGLAGEKLLHGGLFEVALLGDELVELGNQGIDIGESCGDGALFGEGWKWDRQLAILLAIDSGLATSHRHKTDPIPVGSCRDV